MKCLSEGFDAWTGHREEMLRVMYLPEDVRARSFTVEEVMHYNLGADSWPTAQAVILQLHAIPGASINWTQLLVSPGSFQAGLRDKLWVFAF